MNVTLSPMTSTAPPPSRSTLAAVALISGSHALWLVFFGALGAGFMLIEVSVLQRFVLLLGHPVYSLTVTLFSLLLGTGIGAAWSRRFDQATLRPRAAVALIGIVALGGAVLALVARLVTWAVPLPRVARIAVAAVVLVPIGIALGFRCRPASEC
jgi:hypothetical protein